MRKARYKTYWTKNMLVFVVKGSDVKKKIPRKSNYRLDITYFIRSVLYAKKKLFNRNEMLTLNFVANYYQLP